MIGEPPELLDYGAERRRSHGSLIVRSATTSTIVLGSRQVPATLRADAGRRHVLRRRRGGGGAVLLRPADMWVDWWLPAGSWPHDESISETARRVGGWWAEVLSRGVQGTVDVHSGALRGAPELRVACFAALGEGEVTVDGVKVVGLTQWRVREGALVSTVLPSSSSVELLAELAVAPPGLAEALAHGSLHSLGLVSRVPSLLDDLVEASGLPID